MKIKNIFKLNLFKFILSLLILFISAFFSNELLIVCKPGAICTSPVYAYISGILFLIDLIYIITSIIYTIYFKLEKI